MQRFTLLFAVGTLAACAATPQLTIPDAQGAHRTSVAAVLAAHPLPREQNISATLLGRTDSVSYHVVQIRDREQPHVHAHHDLVVTLLRGRGQLYIWGVAHDMRPGDVAVVPQGTPHYFVNGEGSPEGTPAAAFVAFAPPYDGQDQVPAQ